MYTQFNLTMCSNCDYKDDLTRCYDMTHNVNPPLFNHFQSLCFVIEYSRRDIHFHLESIFVHLEPQCFQCMKSI